MHLSTFPGCFCLALTSTAHPLRRTTLRSCPLLVVFAAQQCKPLQSLTPEAPPSPPRSWPRLIATRRRLGLTLIDEMAGVAQLAMRKASEPQLTSNATLHPGVEVVRRASPRGCRCPHGVRYRRQNDFARTWGRCATAHETSPWHRLGFWLPRIPTTLRGACPSIPHSQRRDSSCAIPHCRHLFAR